MKIRPYMIVTGFGVFALMLVVFFAVLVVALVSSGDEDGDEVSSSPTPPSVAETTTPQTATVIAAVNSPTPLSTAQSALAPTPTPLRFATSAPPPTLVAQPGNNQGNNPPTTTAIGLTSPVSGSLLRGNIAILGSASSPDFIQYALEYGPEPNPSNLWYPITSVPITRTVVNGALGAWNTRGVADGNYQIRLHVWLRNNVEDFRVVNNLRVQNADVTQAPTNQNPTLTPISNVSLTKGKSVTIAMGISDPDGDPVTYLVQIANPSVSTVTPSGASAITVNGLNTGTTNVTVTINDGRGGTASTAFTVTVTDPPTTNNPPNMAPIPAQSVLVGQNLNLNVVVSDPDANDTVSVTAASSAAGVATASVSGKTLTIAGISQGTAGINVTATDAQGLSTTTSFSVTVTNPVSNTPPDLSPVSNQTITAGTILDIPLTVSDPDGDPLTVTATSGNDGIVTALVVGNNSIQLNGVSGGSATVQVKADDLKGGSASTSFNVVVEPAQSLNNPPVIDAIQDQTVDVGSTISVAVNASDPDAADTVSINAVADPAGQVTISVSGNSLSITGSAAGNTTVTVTASDGKESVTTTFGVTVNQVVAANQAPTVDDIADFTCVVGDTPTVNVTYSDPDGETPTIITPLANDNPGSLAVSFDGANTISVSCLSAGVATVTVVAQDAAGLTGSDSFTVIVDAPAPPPNTPPVFDPVAAITCTEGDTPTVSFSYSDPDGDPLTVNQPSSDNQGVATVALVDNNNVQVTCIAQGQATIGLSVTDGQDTASGGFGVTVNAPAANNAPVLDAVAPITCTEGEAPTVSFTYSDPEGDAVTVNQPSSDNQGVATVALVDNNNVQVTCIAQGQATIGLSITDSVNTTTGGFGVTVNAPAPPPNTPPVIDPIAGISCEENTSANVPISYSDADGNAINIGQPSSDNQNVATASVLDANTITVNCGAAGVATITVPIDDGTDGASASFGVTVNAAAPPPNNPPVLDGIADVVCNEGEAPSVPISYSDADGNAINVGQPASDNPGVVTASLFDNNTIQLTCVAAGTATVSISIDDGTDAANTSFFVTVNGAAPPPPSFDVTVYPETPNIGNLTSNLNTIYSNGQNAGNQNTSFTVIGDESAASLLTGFASGPYELGNQGDLQGLIDFYTGGAPDNTFNDPSVAVGNGWGIENVFRTDLAPAECGGISPLQCELAQSTPVIVFVSFTPANAAQIGVDDFRANLQNIVGTVTSIGSIPVLMTLPDDGALDAATLAQYNEAIVEVATNANVPLWNVYNTMDPVGSGSVYTAFNGDPTNLTDAALQSAGENRRSLAALRILQSIKNTYFP